MTRIELLEKFDIVYTNYIKLRWRHERVKNKFSPIIFELMAKWFNTWFANGENFQLKIPSKIKFSGSYRRKDIVRIFSELGLKVTRYTREYRKTIVHFEPISNSQQ